MLRSIRWLLRLLLIALGLLAALVWWQRGQLQVLALARIDPVPQTQALVDAGRYAEAAETLDFFMAYPYVAQDPAARQLQHTIASTRSSWQYQGQKLAEGLLHGRSDENIGQLAGVASDLMVIGDLRELAVQGWRHARNEDTDPVLVALASLGVAASAVQLGSAAASIPTAGASAPVAAGATGIKTGLSTLKSMRRLGRLPDWLSDTLVASARQAKRERSLDGMRSVQQLLGDVGTLAQTPGGPRLLAATTDAASLAHAARLARAHGRHTATLQRIGSGTFGEMVQLTERHGTAAVQLAATYGQRGLRALGQGGAVRFAKYSARAGKIAYKGDALRLLAGWLARLPTAWLAGLIALGLWALWPRRRRRLRAKPTAAGHAAQRMRARELSLRAPP